MMRGRPRRWLLGLVLVATTLSGCARAVSSDRVAETTAQRQGASPTAPADASTARAALDELSIKGRAPMAGYARAEFGSAWTDASDAPWSRDGLSTRDDVLSRDLTSVLCKVQPPRTAAGRCVVRSGVLHDPYTDRTIDFMRGVTTSLAVQIDHVVALGDSWQTGAQRLTRAERVDLANDPLELVAVDGPTNEAKGDGDAATWLPPNRSFRCAYVARQVAVKFKYHLWVTAAERAAVARVLSRCPDQPLPTSAGAEHRTY